MVEVIVPEPIQKSEKADSFKIPEFYIKYRGTFDFQKLYNYIMSFLSDQKFVVYETKHKYKPPELELDIIGRRRVSGYLRWGIDIHIHMFFSERIPKMVNGKPTELVTARLKIDLKGEVETGYANYFKENPWDDTSIGRKLKVIYNKIFNKDLNFKQADLLYYVIYDLQTGIKDKINSSVKGSAY